jgi:hypothetical protein
MYLCIYSSEKYGISSVILLTLDSVVPYKVMAWLERECSFPLHYLSSCKHFVFWDFFLACCLRLDRKNLVDPIFTVHIIWLSVHVKKKQKKKKTHTHTQSKKLSKDTEYASLKMIFGFNSRNFSKSTIILEIQKHALLRHIKPERSTYI